MFLPRQAASFIQYEQRRSRINSFTALTAQDGFGSVQLPAGQFALEELDAEGNFHCNDEC